MNTNNNEALRFKWLYIIGGLIVLLGTINLWMLFNSSKSIDNFSALHRDSVIELKIDSVMQSVNDFREIYGNDRLIADKEQKIINNYSIYNQKKNELLKNPIDSVYNWTKHQLNLRAK
jgi:hypothetical protein